MKESEKLNLDSADGNHLNKEKLQNLNESNQKVKAITRCPHVNRKHYAKVRTPTFTNLHIEHVFKLLQKVWEKSECLELYSSRQTSLLDGDVPDLLFIRLSQGKLNSYLIGNSGKEKGNRLACRQLSQMIHSIRTLLEWIMVLVSYLSFFLSCPSSFSS